MPEQIKTPVPDIINEMSRTDVFLIRGATLIHRPSVCEGRCALRDTLIPLTLTCVCTSQLFRHSARAAPSAGHFLPQLTVRLSAMPGSLWGLTQAFLRIIGFLPLIISQPPPFVKRMTEKECGQCPRSAWFQFSIGTGGQCPPPQCGAPILYRHGRVTTHPETGHTAQECAFSFVLSFPLAKAIQQHRICEQWNLSYKTRGTNSASCQVLMGVVTRPRL